jgi:hypothetical protein
MEENNELFEYKVKDAFLASTIHNSSRWTQTYYLVDEAIVRYYSIGARNSETENNCSAVDTPNESFKPVPSTAANATNSQSTEIASLKALGKVAKTSHDLSSLMFS